MPRAKKSSNELSKGTIPRAMGGALPDEPEEQDLPNDEAGRVKIKRQYEELLGIRIEKLKGRVLNREKINKTIEGIYYICFDCKRICHNLDEGLIQNTAQDTCHCGTCGKGKHATASR